MPISRPIFQQSIPVFPRAGDAVGNLKTFFRKSCLLFVEGRGREREKLAHF